LSAIYRFAPRNHAIVQRQRARLLSDADALPPLMLQTPDANLSCCMRHLNGVYSQKYNMGYGCDGTLFRERYKSTLVDADSHFLQLVRYIHRNPL
jgi:hypothetical protein